MRIVLSALLVALTCGLAACEMSEEEFYTKVFEEVDPDFILDNERILTTYLKCFYNEIECNPHAEVVKTAMVWLLLFTMVIAAGAAPQTEEDMEFYTRVFEEVDPDFILDNERILTSYLKCFYNEIDCNAHAEVVKKSIPDVLSTVCGRCSEKQKGIFKYSLNKFIPAHPKEWERILSIYDPTGEAWPKVKAFIES